MAENKNTSCDLSCRRNKVGGQAVLEGVMMKSGDLCALSVRTKDGIVTETKNFTSWRKKYKPLGIPIVRGAVNMIEMLRLSYSTLGRSAELAMPEGETEEPGKFERWLTEKLGDKLMSVFMSIAGVLGVVLALFLFKVIPTFVTMLINNYVMPLGWFCNLVEGVIKIAIFVGYMALVALMPDIKRTFEYHGAEHKSIACYERGLEMTPANAKTCTRFHPRCGTSFIFVILILNILIFSLLPWGSFWLRILLQLVLLPVVVGLSFEFIMYAGRHDNVLTRVLSAPGLAMQRITTREPDEDQLAVAIASLKAALPDEFPPEEAAAADGASDESDSDKADDSDTDDDK